MKKPERMPDEAIPSGRVKCCLCRSTVDERGWCGACNIWQINVTPCRVCDSGHVVKADGWCWECQAYVATELLPESGAWRDTGKIPRRLPARHVQALLRELSERMSLDEQPREVPLNRRYIPRRWLREELAVVGYTPIGDEIVLPRRLLKAQESVVDADELPF